MDRHKELEYLYSGLRVVCFRFEQVENRMGGDVDLCERLESCGFFQTYGRQEGSSWRGFVACYCMGPLVDRCARRVLGLRHGVEPAPEIMPSGEAIS